MGLDFEYVFITEADQLARLREALTVYLSEEGQQRLADAVEDQSPCLTFRFASDGALARYSEAAGVEVIELGGIYVSQSVGTRYALLRATAATTEMSLLFEESPSIREAMRDIGRGAGALCVLLDRETDRYPQLWPEQRQIRVVRTFEDDDAWCRAVLAATSRPAGGSPWKWPDWRDRWLDRDLVFYESLGEERGDHHCREETCNRGAVLLSVFCRVHHFVNVRGRTCPFDD